MKKWSINLVVAASLFAAAVFAVPAAAGAATCPGPNPGEEYKPCPTVVFNEVASTPNSTQLSLKVTEPGKVKVNGPGLETSTVSVKAGKVKVKLKLTPKEEEKLEEKGKLTFKVRITYTPTGGSPVSKTVKVTVKAPKSSQK